jgi:hypothetical protein
MTNEREMPLGFSEESFNQSDDVQLSQEAKEALKELPWQLKVGLMSAMSLLQVVDQSVLPRIEVQNPQGLDDTAVKILKGMYDLDLEGLQSLKADPEKALPLVARSRYTFYENLSRDIKKDQRYYLLEKLLTTISINNNLPNHVKGLLYSDVSTLHLMLGREDRLLVGLKDGVIWRNIKWDLKALQSVDSIHYMRAVSMINLNTLPLIGRKEAEIIPERPITLEKRNNLRVPTPAQSVEVSLEQAYYGQRYIIPPNGAEVRFNKAGDIGKVLLLQSRNILFAKIITEKGEALVSLSLETGKDISNVIGSKAPLAEIVAEVYRDMVTAEVVHAHRMRRLDNLRLPLEEREDIEEGVQVTYIPRKVKIGEDEDFRSKYEGPARPLKPHRVTGHRRKANMTEQHRQALLEFEAEHGISILENLPAGYTFVRPHVVPAGERLSELPIFIKRRIETRLREDLNLPKDNTEEVQDTELRNSQEAVIIGKNKRFKLPKFRRN